MLFGILEHWMISLRVLKSCNTTAGQSSSILRLHSPSLSVRLAGPAGDMNEHVRLSLLLLLSISSNTGCFSLLAPWISKPGTCEVLTCCLRPTSRVCHFPPPDFPLEVPIPSPCCRLWISLWLPLYDYTGQSDSPSWESDFVAPCQSKLWQSNPVRVWMNIKIMLHSFWFQPNRPCDRVYRHFAPLSYLPNQVLPRDGSLGIPSR